MNLMVEVIRDDLSVPKGTKLLVEYIDSDGDARLKEIDVDKYGTYWLFDGDFVRIPEYGVVAEEVTSSQMFKVTITVNGLTKLQDLLDGLSESMVESTALEVIK